MARKKTITRDQILDAAYDVVAKEGFSHFTARNIAAKMKCSTQPIYLEFKNMDDLKHVLVEKVIEELSNKLLHKEITGDKLLDLGINSIEFANKEKQLYKALYLEGAADVSKMKEYSYEYFVENIITDTEYAELSEEQIKSVYSGFWILVSGLSALTSSGILEFKQEEIIELLNGSFETMKSSQPLDMSFKTLPR